MKFNVAKTTKLPEISHIEYAVLRECMNQPIMPAEVGRRLKRVYDAEYTRQWPYDVCKKLNDAGLVEASTNNRRTLYRTTLAGGVAMAKVELFYQHMGDSRNVQMASERKSKKT